MNVRGTTTKQYDQAWNDLRAAGHANPKGLLHHICAQKGNDLVVVDVWESQEAFTKYAEILGPIMVKNGMPKVEPTFLPVHNEYKNQ